MLPQLSAAVRVSLCTRPTDMRKSFDGLSGLGNRSRSGIAGIRQP
jgi:hypothetical protein